MQIIFQDPYSTLDPRKTIERPSASRSGSPSLRRATRSNGRVIELMELVGLRAPHATAYPHELDGGRRQRVGIARALAMKPEFIVCDEPVSALDVSIQAQILNLLQDLQEKRGLTYLFVTHDMSVVKHLSDNICVMYLGQLAEISPAKELFRHPLHPYTKIAAERHSDAGPAQSDPAHHHERRDHLAHRPGARLPLRRPLRLL